MIGLWSDKYNLLILKMEFRDYCSSLAELGDCLTGLHNLVKQPFRGLVVPEHVIETLFTLIYLHNL